MSAADTLSALLGLLLMGDGLHNDDWGDVTDNNLTIIESAIAGVGQINNGGTGLTGGTLTLQAADVLPSVLVFSGALTANQVINVPAKSKTWIFDNQTTGAFSLLVQTATGSGINVPQGQLTEAYCDGTNVKALTFQGTPVGVVEEYFGIELPDARYVWANGQVINRIAYNAVFNALTRTTTVSFATGVMTFALAEDLTGKGLIGSAVEGPGIPTSATVTSLTSNSITISAATTGATAGATMRFFPYGNGDGSTTFAVPDRRECVAVGSSVMGGTASPSRITTASMANGANLGQRAGEDLHTLSVAEMASHNHALTDPSHAHATTDPTHAHAYSNTDVTTGISGSAFGKLVQDSALTGAAATGISVNSSTTGITLAATGGGGAHNNLQPLLVCNYILRVA